MSHGTETSWEGRHSSSFVVTLSGSFESTWWHTRQTFQYLPLGLQLQEDVLQSLTCRLYPHSVWMTERYSVANCIAEQ